MKAIVIHHYWAWAIAAGHKRVENRTWRTNYRGPLAIVAGCSRESLEASRDLLVRLGIDPPAEESLAFGKVVAIVDLVDCVELSNQRLFGDDHDLTGDAFATGPYCWILANARSLDEPIAVRGMPGLFDVPHDVLAAVL